MKYQEQPYATNLEYAPLYRAMCYEATGSPLCPSEWKGEGMGIDYKELALQACVVNIEEGKAMELEFDSFEDASDFIIDNPIEFEGMKLTEARVYYKLVPQGTAFGDERYRYTEASSPWMPLFPDQVRRIKEDYQAAVDVQSMSPCGIQCILRLYVEDQRARLLLERDFATFAELNAFIAENPDLKELVGEEHPVPSLGMVETLCGKPSRVPLAVTEDGFFLSMSWEPLSLRRQKNLVSEYRESFEEREARIMSVLSPRDRKDLQSGHPSRKTELLYAVVSLLVRKGYDVSHAQSIVAVCEPGSTVPHCYDIEIAFKSCRSFPLDLPKEISFSKAQGKITFLASAEPLGDFDAELREFTDKQGRFVTERRDIGTLDLLLSWAMALPERP